MGIYKLGNEIAAEQLGEAKKSAQQRANRDGTEWYVTKRNSASYPYGLTEDVQYSSFLHGKIIARMKPNVITINLTPEEAEKYQEYLETERYDDDGKEMEGGMFRTPVEESIFQKLLKAIGVK